MRQVENYLPASGSGSAGENTSNKFVSSEQENPELSTVISQKLWNLWEAMSDIYGPLWDSTFGDKPNKTWSLVLERYAEESLLRGIMRCIESKEKYPPNLGQFRAYSDEREGPYLGASRTMPTQGYKVLEDKRSFEQRRSGVMAAREKAMLEIRAVLGISR